VARALLRLAAGVALGDLGKLWRIGSTGKDWPEIGIAQQHETQIPGHNLRMRLRANLTNPYLASHRVLVEVVQSNDKHLSAALAFVRFGGL
jgi:hypothetical protein